MSGGPSRGVPSLRRQHWIEFAGTRLSLDGESVLVGRNPDCDVVLADPRVSRHHVLFRATGNGVDVVPLGARSVSVNGTARDTPFELGDGDRVEVVGQVFVVHFAGTRPAAEVHWFVEREAGVLVRVGDARMTLGGGDDDRVVMRSWPAGAVALEIVGARLVLESCVDGVSVGRPLDAGEMITVARGDRIAWGAESVRMVALPADPANPTLSTAPDQLVRGAVLTFLPRGGRLALRVGERERKVFLTGKRCDLIACVLRPPAPYAPGDVIPDAVIAERVWPGGYAGRTDINTLLWRIRRDFCDAGLDCVSFFERKGGGLRAMIVDGGRAEVQGRPEAEP